MAITTKMREVIHAQQKAGTSAGYVLDGFSAEQLDKVYAFIESFRAAEIASIRETQAHVFEVIERYFMRQSNELRDMVLRGTADNE